MARIRTIKPEFWTSEQVMDLSRDARICFIGMWNFCDDAGIHPASPKSLKAKVFPGDDMTSADIRRLIDECIRVGLIEEYEYDGEYYWIVTGWCHQKIDKPTYKFPTPDGTVPQGAVKRRPSKKPSAPQPPVPPTSPQPEHAAEQAPDASNTPGTVAERSPNANGAFDEHSTSTRRAFEESSPPEGEGERKGKGGKPLSKANGVGHYACAREAPLSAAAVSIALIGWERERHKRAPVSASNPHVIELAERDVSEPELRRAYDSAVAERLAADDKGPINASFVTVFIDKARAPPRVKADGWNRTDEGISRKAKELGVAARRGESYGELKDRVFEEINRITRTGAPT